MIDAIYYDGRHTRRHQVTVVIHKRVIAMRGEEGLRRSERLSRFDISERLDAAPRILRFPDGAFIEVRDQKKLDKMLALNRFINPRVVRWQNNWPLSLGALLGVLVFLAATYSWGLPLAADALAMHMPASVEKRFGDASLEMMEGKMIAPSKLPVAEQTRLRALFAAMLQPRGEKTPYRLEFRASNVGPNAFALPNGVIVMTDELVYSVNDDEAILGVLSHEMGHLKYRHSARQVMRTAGVGLVLNLWVGDVSSALVVGPSLLMKNKFSRDFEREADNYAIEMMAANRRSLAPMADMLEAMQKFKEKIEKKAKEVRKIMSAQSRAEAAEREAEYGPGGGPQTVEEEADEIEDVELTDEEYDKIGVKRERKKGPPPDYFSTHPSDEERVLKLRAAELRRIAALLTAPAAPAPAVAPAAAAPAAALAPSAAVTAPGAIVIPAAEAGAAATSVVVPPKPKLPASTPAYSDDPIGDPDYQPPEVVSRPSKRAEAAQPSTELSKPRR
jgi:Zn-dependent protease with chaperone function